MKATKTINISFPQYRPSVVYLSHGVHRALFHHWVTKQGVLPSGSQYTTVQALVELEDGNVESVRPEDIKFIGSKQLFEQFAWGDEKVNG